MQGCQPVGQRPLLSGEQEPRDQPTALGGHQEPLELLGGQLGLQQGSWWGLWVQGGQLVLQGQREQLGQQQGCPLLAFWGLGGQLELQEWPGQQQGSWGLL